MVLWPPVSTIEGYIDLLYEGGGGNVASRANN